VSMVFRNADSRYPFLWETPDQPAARWHGEGEGPAQYVADTPDGAWAEFLRHEEIVDPDDLGGVARSLWAIEVDDAELDAAEEIDATEGRGGLDSYAVCQQLARDARSAGARAIRAPSAALLPGAGRGERTDGTLVPGEDRDGVVWVLYGRRPDLVGWRIVQAGRPEERVLELVRPLS
jgi:hypothetical protein